MDQAGIGDVAVVQDQYLKDGQLREMFPGGVWKLVAFEAQVTEVRQRLEVFEAGAGKLRTTAEAKTLQLGQALEVSQPGVAYTPTAEDKTHQLGQALPSN